MTNTLHKILIHSHPQYAYLVRCILHERYLYPYIPPSDKEYLILFGANYLQSMDYHFKSFLESSLILNQIAPSVRLTSYSAIQPYSNLRSYQDNLDGFIKDFFPENLSVIRTLILDCLQDSICRGLSKNSIDPFQYYTGSAELKKIALNGEWTILLDMFCRYRTYLLTELPTVVYISHGNYTPYIALILAAKSLNIRIVLVHGGHQFIFEPLDDTAYSTLSPLNAVRSILHDKFPEPFYYSSRKSSISVRDANTFVSATRPREQSTSPFTAHVDCVSIALPIFTEVNNHYSSAGVVFSNRYDWLKATLAILEKTTLPVIIKRHPHESEHEPILVNKILDHLLSLYPGLDKRTVIIKDSSSLLAAYKHFGVSGLHTEFLIFQSMSCCELPQIGRRAHSANPCFAHDSFVYTYNSLSEYEHAILSLQDRPLIKPVSIEEALLSGLYISLCNQLGHGNEVGGYRVAFDQFYHFGRIRLSNLRMHNNLFEFCLKNITFKALSGTRYTVYKEVSNDLLTCTMLSRKFSLAS